MQGSEFRVTVKGLGVGLLCPGPWVAHQLMSVSKPCCTPLQLPPAARPCCAPLLHTSTAPPWPSLFFPCCGPVAFAYAEITPAELAALHAVARVWALGALGALGTVG